ncbi:MAG: 30S ribosomal protein S1 [Candidatus Curtissbacteria bacterium GW2011_GWC2_41_21]|nr:MAG: 30S ribosomal protein S1 [Candidatus Curtissbacteria bacterium GW2011_GWC2_41_21]
MPKSKTSKSATTGKSSAKFSSMEELLASTGYNIPSLRRGQEVSGKIVSITPSEILVDIGAKSEGIVAGRELTAVRDLALKLSAGDKIDVTILYPENDAGQVVLSMRKVSQDTRWKELENRKETGEDIEVVAIEVNRGPASQLAASSQATDLIGKNLTARIIEVDRGTNRLILSQRQPKKADLEAILKQLTKVKIGQKLSGVVTAVLPFGVFVEINLEVSNGTKGSKVSKGEEISGTSKLEGLVHISEISWEKVDDPKKLFKVGDKLEVMIIAKDETTGRLNLSIKQLAKDPFTEASAKYSKDEMITGTVARVSPYGIFVTLEEGVEGLMHISKIPPEYD